MATINLNERKPIVVSKFRDGSIIRAMEDKPNILSICIKQTRELVSDTGWDNTSNRVFFLTIDKERATPERVAAFEARAVEGNVIAGKDLVVEEYYEPQYDGHEPKEYPSTHKNAGEPVLYNGREVYRRTFLRDIGSKDTLISERPLPQETPLEVGAEDKAFED